VFVFVSFRSALCPKSACPLSTACMHVVSYFVLLISFGYISFSFLANFATIWLSQMIYPPRKGGRRRVPPKPPTLPPRLHAFNKQQQMPQTHKGSPMATSNLPTTQAAAVTLRAPLLVVHDAGVRNRTRNLKTTFPSPGVHQVDLYGLPSTSGIPGNTTSHTKWKR
jgi:hypothetical protein